MRGRAFAAALLLLIGAASFAAPIAVHDLFAHPERGHFRVAPDGTRLAWLAPVAQADGTRRRNVVVQDIDADGRLAGTPRVVTHETAADVPDVTWKDRDTLLWRRDGGGDEAFHLIAVDVASGVARDLTPGAGVRARLLDVLPGDAHHVLATSTAREAGVEDVVRIDVRDGRATRVATNPGDVTGWFPDHAGRVRLARRTSGRTTTLAVRAGDDADAPWRPLIVTDARTELTPLFFDADDRAFLALSDRGRDRRALVRIDPDHPYGEQVVAAGADVDIDGAAWSRARRRVARADLADDGRVHRVLDPAQAPAWERLRARFPGLDVEVQSEDDAGRRAVVAVDSDRTPGTRWLWDAATGQLEPLGVLAPGLPVAGLAAMRPVRYAARDGVAIPAFLTLPRDGRTRGLACVVHVHGGPWSRVVRGWDPEVQLLADRGFCVLQPNFRGSAGYGRAFREAGDREWGRRMQQDLDDGADWLVAQGIADRRRLALVGASYGGYATLAGLAFEPARWAAGVEAAGPADLVAFMEGLPDNWAAQADALRQSIGDPRDAAGRARLAAVSPAAHLDGLVAPLLVGQGANDPRVPRAGTDALVEALRARGRPVEELVFDGEGHGLRDEAHRIAWETALADFLVRHLRPGQAPAP